MKTDKSEKEWRAESDLSTLIEAQKIKKDKPRFNAAMKKREERMKMMDSLNEEKKEY